MKYWPLYAVTDAMEFSGSPYAAEMRLLYHKPPSEAAFYAALDAAVSLPAVDAPNLVIIESVGAPNRRVFTHYPDLTEWLRLERTAVMEHDEYTFMLMDALH